MYPTAMEGGTCDPSLFRVPSNRSILNTMPTEPIRLPEAARRLGITTKAAYKLVDDGTLAATLRPDGWPSVDSEAVDALAAARSTDARAASVTGPSARPPGSLPPAADG